MSDPIYIVGIDLGTTNSVVAYTKARIEKGEKPEINVLDIPQLVDAAVVGTKKMLPSFILVPGSHDVGPGSLELPWAKDKDMAVGEFAKERGAEIPQRLISSSKSWLCHSLVDRNQPILPWEGPDDMKKLSPVEAAAEILGHIRDGWNHTMAKDDDSLILENQEILLTVPASFDAVARDLTVKAAKMAGFENITLLEEPMAAFYAWIESSEDMWREKIKQGDLILVCDIGGGTSDFSLIRVDEEDGDLRLERIAVGDHLLVGGDNIDLALAFEVSKNIPGKKLNAWQMRSLWHSCRKAKEAIFSHKDIDDYPITLLGRGKSLIGGTIKTRLSKDIVEKVILDGFFPFCKEDEAPEARQKFGIKEVGLSYEADPAITRHLAHFLTRQKNEAETEIFPTAVLFNGGVMKASPVREQVMEILSSWSQKPVREIDVKDFDLTVAKGAAYYGLARKGGGIRIRGGLNRSYYIGVAASIPAVPGMPVPIRALCVAPFGMEEGTSMALEGREFVLVVGEPVKFDFMASSIRLEDEIGTIVDEWEDEIEEVTSLEASLDGEAGSAVPVFLEAVATEIGTLEIWCVSKNDPQKRWKLEFNVREKETL